MKRIASFVVVATVVSAPAVAAQQVESDSAQVHVVREGDTLWDLARQYLRDPFLWPQIFSANQGSVLDPDLIFPRSRLLIPGLTRSEVLGSAPPPAGRARSAATPNGPPSRTVFYTGDEQRASRATTFLTTPPEEVPVVPPGLFFAAGILAPDAEMNSVGRLVEVVSPTVVERSAPPQIQPYDRVNMVVGGAGVTVGERIYLMRRGREVEPYGRIYLPTGSARVLAVEAGVATVEVDQFYDRVEAGDLAFRMPEFLVPAGVSPVPAAGLEGELLAFRAGEPVVGTEDVAYVNLGTASGVVVGDEFVVYLPAVQEDWGRRPEIEIARLQVLRTSRLTSAVRVISLEQPALEEGQPVRLVARMP